MGNCPKYCKCSAPICPVDVEWLIRVHLKGERVCFYLTEYSKPPVRAILRGSLPIELHEAIAKAYPRVIDRHCSIKNRLKEAAKTPSRLSRQIKGVAA